MSNIISYARNGNTRLQRVEPEARGLTITVRAATQEDFPWIDALQKAEADKVGFLPEVAIRKRIGEGNVLVAEGKGLRGSGAERLSEEQIGEGSSPSAPQPLSTSAPSSSSLSPLAPSSPSAPLPLGYCMGVDRYMKQDHLGIIYQMCVKPEYRRSLVAASLLQAQFDKSAYGVRLYCCWCKQSLAANRFWESMGFVPLAFRAGGRVLKKGEPSEGTVHIFWQKKIRIEEQGEAGGASGDASGDASGGASGGTSGGAGGWWYPYETTGGLMAEGRLVLPLPPGVEWDDEMPVVLPGSEERERELLLLEDQVESAKRAERQAKRQAKLEGRLEGGGPGAVPPPIATPPRGRGRGSRVVTIGGFGVPFGEAAERLKEEQKLAAQRAEVEASSATALAKEAKREAKRALREAQRRNDPAMVEKARELRDKWQEHVTRDPMMIEGRQRGRYEVGRMLEGPGVAGAVGAVGAVGVKRLEAA